jgi:integrase
MARLTTRTVETIKPGKVRREIPDGHMRGLYFIVQPSGATSWAVRYRHLGEPRKHTLGAYPAIDLKAARELGAKALRVAAEGRDPAAEKRQAKAARPDNFKQVADRFVEQYCRRNNRPRTLAMVQGILHLHVLPKWRDRSVASITSSDVRDLLARIVDAAPVAANRTFAVLRKLFNWCVEHEAIAVSPCAGVKRPAREKSRDRVLSDAELRRVWDAAEKIGYPFGSVVQLLILTGQRRGEVAGMQWSEVSLEPGLWTLPRERTKNDKRHEVPLATQAVDAIRQVPQISERLVFTTNAKVAVTGFTRLKHRLDKLSGFADWRVHDLRRTVASGMARLGISLPVIEKVLNHASGSFAGIVGVYQHHAFTDEKRAALQTWADHVERLVSGKPATVLQLRGHKP